MKARIRHVKNSHTSPIFRQAQDELVEITPKNIRLRKKFLKEHERKRQK